MFEREQERHTREMFDKWLREEYPDSYINWEKVPQELEPPDYYLHFAKTRYAVEVTSIFFPEFVRDGKNVAMPAIQAMLRASFAKLVASLSQRGILKGFYSVLIEGPLERYSSQEAELHLRIAEVVEQTRDDELVLFPAKKIVHEGFSLLVTKLGFETTDIGWGIASAAGAEPVVELTKQVTAAIETKASKLMEVKEPAILLLLDETYVSTPFEYVEVAKRLERAHQFNAIFVVTVPRGVNKFFREKVFPVYLSGCGPF